MKKYSPVAVIVGFVLGFWLALPGDYTYQRKTAAEWLPFLDSPNFAARTKAVEALGEIGKEESRRVTGVRRALLDGFKAMGIRLHGRMIPPLVERLGDREASVRMTAMTKLIQMGKYALPDLERVMARADSDLYRNAGLTIAKIDPTSPFAMSPADFPTDSAGTFEPTPTAPSPIAPPGPRVLTADEQMKQEAFRKALAGADRPMPSLSNTNAPPKPPPSANYGMGVP